jgi:hypothetical protein
MNAGRVEEETKGGEWWRFASPDLLMALSQLSIKVET